MYRHTKHNSATHTSHHHEKHNHYYRFLSGIHVSSFFSYFSSYSSSSSRLCHHIISWRHRNSIGIPISPPLVFLIFPSCIHQAIPCYRCCKTMKQRNKHLQKSNLQHTTNLPDEPLNTFKKSLSIEREREWKERALQFGKGEHWREKKMLLPLFLIPVYFPTFHFPFFSILPIQTGRTFWSA